MRHFADVSGFFQIRRLYTAFSRTLEKDYYFAGQQHDFWELVIVTDGQVGVTAGTDVFVLEKGQAVIHEPMEFHRLWAEGNAQAGILILTFAADGVPHYADKFFPHADVDAAKAVLQSLRSCFQTSNMDLTGIMPEMDLKSQLALKDLELFILRLLSQKANVPALTSRPARNYATIVKVLEDHIHQNLSIADIAKLCSMGEVSIKQTFSRFAGMGVMHYFNRLKVTYAIDLLQKGATVQEVATALGFANQNYFSTVFKRITGKSPSAYKADR